MAAEPTIAVLNATPAVRGNRADHLCAAMLRLLGADETGSEFLDSHHNLCRFLLGRRSWPWRIPALARH